ncbi:MAG: hypothetical protein AABN95_26895 [Acidobacteriota bacterium]
MQFRAMHLITERSAVARDPGGNLALRSAMLLILRFLKHPALPRWVLYLICASAEIIKLHQYPEPFGIWFPDNAKEEEI